jgi:hypothetical protein
MNSEANLPMSCLSEKSNVSRVLNAPVAFVLTLNLAHHVVDKLKRTKNNHVDLTTVVFPF